MTVDLSYLRVLRSKMTRGNVVRCATADDAAGLSATHKAADTLIEIAELAKALRSAKCTDGAPGSMDACSGALHTVYCEIDKAERRLDAALAKVITTPSKGL